VSVVLHPRSGGPVAREAKRRGLKLSTAIPGMVSERGFREIEEAQELTQAEHWQRAQRGPRGKDSIRRPAARSPRRRSSGVRSALARYPSTRR